MPRDGCANIRAANRIIDLRLQDARQRAHIAMDLPEKQGNLRCRGIRVGLNIVLAGGLKTVADLGGSITRQPLHVPEREAAADKKIKQHGSADE